VRQVDKFDWDKFMRLSTVYGIVWGKDHGWCKKATWQGHHIDFFDPDASSGDHTSGADPVDKPI
jgi:hypothetical protein